MMKKDWYVYKLCPKYRRHTSTSRIITLQQIHILDNEYEVISNQQKTSKIDRERLLEIDKQTANWTPIL